jgi:hypothetical protein
MKLKCPHLRWRDGDQYATFFGPTEYARDEAEDSVRLAVAPLVFDGQPHLCGRRRSVYVVRLK